MHEPNLYAGKCISRLLIEVFDILQLANHRYESIIIIIQNKIFFNVQ